MAKLLKPARTGHGALLIARQSHPVTFEIRVVGSRGQMTAKGGVTGAPHAMRDAFKRGHARLELDDGQALDVAIVAHAEGSPTAYFDTHA